MDYNASTQYEIWNQKKNKINRTKVKTISNYILLYYNTVLHTRNALLLKLTEEYFLINLYHVD